MKITWENKIYHLPDCLIVGAAKAGTTSLYNYLTLHPGIFNQKIKEPWFFTFYNNNPEFSSPDNLPGIISDLDEYSALYSTASNQLSIDASPMYLFKYKETISNIKKIYGKDYKKLHIIILIRDPAERAWSMYKHFRKNLHEELPFRIAVRKDIIKERMRKNFNYFYDYIEAGLYYEQVKAYQQTFPRVYVATFEELKSSPASLIAEIFEFLGVPQKNISNKFAIYNKSRVYNKKLSFLRPFYRWYINKYNPIRTFIRKIIPLNIRSSIDNRIKNLFRTDKINKPVEIINQLKKEYYLQDLNNLKHIVQEKNKSVIDKWLQI